jgi:hypothetical protein
LRCVIIRAPFPRFFFSALRAVAGSVKERPAAEKPARPSLLSSPLKNRQHNRQTTVFVIAKPGPIG